MAPPRLPLYLFLALYGCLLCGGVIWLLAHGWNPA